MPNKAQFIEALAVQKFEGDKKRAAAALDGVIDTLYGFVAKGERVALTGFGIFEKRERAARIARNPATGASVRVKKTFVPAFRAGAEFKDITAGRKKLAKAPAKKASAAKSTASKSTTKAAAGRATASKALAGTAAAKKATPTKAAAKKAPAKAAKAPAKKAPAKKAAR